jgi:hypothetical protein
MGNIPFQTIDWASIERVAHPGENGVAYWQTVQLGGLRIRIVEYSPGYLADHWCQKGHIVHCLEGEFESELETGEKILLAKGGTLCGLRRTQLPPVKLYAWGQAFDH